MPAPLTTTFFAAAAIVAVLSPAAAIVVAVFGVTNQALVEVANYYATKEPTDGLG